MWGIVRGSSFVAAILAVLAGMGHAEESRSKLVLSAERDLYGFQAQQALVYDDDSVSFVRNSNFFCKPSDEVLLGAFHAPLSAARKTERDYVAEIAARLPKDESSDDSNPHGVRYFIGPKDVTSNATNKQTVDRILTQACEDVTPALSGGWVADRGVVVTQQRVKGRYTLKITALAGAEKGKSKTMTFKAAGCTQRGKARWECPIPDQGLAIFEVKP